MRLALWSEAFADLPAEELLVCVEEVLVGVSRREPSAEVAYLALVEHLELGRGRPDPARRALYEAARAAGNEAVTNLLLTRPAARTMREDAAQVPLLDPDREVTLGERRAMARAHDRDLLARLLHDPDPGVLRNLLANPRLTERDVVKVASRRPIAAESLRIVFRHPRWGRRREVRRALAFNPYTPGDLAAALVAILDRADLRALSADRLVHPAVRDEARRRLGLDEPPEMPPAPAPDEPAPTAVPEDDPPAWSIDPTEIED